MNPVRSIMLMAGAAMGLVGCGAARAQPGGRDAPRVPRHVIEALFVPADSWRDPPASRGYTGHFVTVFGRRWMPLSLVREIMTAVGVSSTLRGDRLAFNVPATVGANVSHLPLLATPSGTSMTLAINGHVVTGLPVLRKPGPGTPYLPVAKTIAALQRTGLKMRWDMGSKNGQVTWRVGAPNYHAIFVITRMGPHGSESVGGMLWVHGGATWISGNTLGNALNQAGGIGFQWPINGQGMLQRVEISVPHSIPADLTAAAGVRPEGVKVAPILINRHRVGYARWSTTPAGSYYFSVKSVMPAVRRIHLASHWAVSSRGVVHWQLGKT